MYSLLNTIPGINVKHVGIYEKTVFYVHYIIPLRLAPTPRQKERANLMQDAAGEGLLNVLSMLMGSCVGCAGQ